MNSKDEIRFGGITVRYLIEAHESNGTVAMFEFEVEPGGKVPGAHSHDGYEETAYGLEGTLTFTVAGETAELGPGQSLVIPAEPSIASTTSAPPKQSVSPSSRPASSAQTSFAR
jgi:quercetin dioxygenase-like cupin family protein